MTEAIDDQYTQFGEERLVELVSQNINLPPADIIEKINSAVSVHSGGAAQFDDMTLMVLKVGTI